MFSFDSECGRYHSCKMLDDVARYREGICLLVAAVTTIWLQLPACWQMSDTDWSPPLPVLDRFDRRWLQFPLSVRLSNDDDSHVNGLRLRLWTAATNGPIVHPRRNTWSCTTLVEYQQGNSWFFHQSSLLILPAEWRSRGSSVSIVSGYGLDDRAIGVRSPAGANDFPSILCVQTGSGANLASCPMGTGGFIPRG
jgi:hypothetical protein